MKKIAILLCVFVSLNLFGQTPVIRPIRDLVGFCWQPKQFQRLMDYLDTHETVPAPEKPVIAGISPHDDYLYAGTVYYPLFKNFHAKEVVIFGVTHGTVRRKIGDPQGKLIFDEYKSWRALHGKVDVSPLRDYLKEKLDPSDVMVSMDAHRFEHSVEALIPFLQYYTRDVKITPIMVTGMDFAAMEKLSAELAKHIAGYIKKNNLKLGTDIAFLVSADANHYGEDFDNLVYGFDERAHLAATNRDQRIAKTYLEGPLTRDNLEGLTKELWGKTYKENNNILWCGKFSIPFGMLAIDKTVRLVDKKNSLNGRLLKYSDTYSEGVLPLKKMSCGITAPFSLRHWVGFFSAAYYLD
jgi:AmmeMemoRadiSam system protein B